jgi:hypothetical protein
MEILRLPLEIQQVFNEAEKSIKEKYLDVVRKLPNEELKNFRKTNYTDINFSQFFLSFSLAKLSDAFIVQCVRHIVTTGFYYIFGYNTI